MSKCFHLTEYRDQDNAITYRAGDVMRDAAAYAFSDWVILGFSITGAVKVARPYAYVRGAGTTGPVVLTGCETMEVGMPWLRHTQRVGSERTL